MALPRAAATVSEAAVQYAKGLSSWFRDYITAIKHGRIHPFTPLERRAVLVFRMQYPPEKWRNVYKSLQVLEFILKRGGEEGIDMAKSEFPAYLDSLSSFSYIGPDNRDYGVNVRVRATAIQKLLQDDALLRVERQNLRQFSQKLKGYAREEMEGRFDEDDVMRSNSWAGGETVQRDPSETGPSVQQAGGNRGAGEMKGVSLEDNKRHLAELKRILAQPQNKLCADCREQMPTWASINCGVFICLKCSGIHRGLGVHISKVRSCTLDTWLPEQVKFLERTGNAIANAYWEAKLQPNQRPRGDLGLATFITEKYTHKRFASGVWPPNIAQAVGPNRPSTTNTPSALRSSAAGASLLESQQQIPTDLLKFEDEAFAFESATDSGKSLREQEVPLATLAEVVAEEAADQPRHRPTLSFENSALFEQRSSFLRMQSHLHSMSSGVQTPASVEKAPATPSTATSRGAPRKNSEDVIKTTLLDLDELESASETMSLSSQRVLFPNVPRVPSSNGLRPQRTKTSSQDSTRGTGRQSNVGAAMTRPTPQSTLLQRNSAPTPASVAVDLLDAPLAPLPVSGPTTVDRGDPFAFMTSLEPLTILTGQPSAGNDRDESQNTSVGESESVTTNAVISSESAVPAAFRGDYPSSAQQFVAVPTPAPVSSAKPRSVSFHQNTPMQNPASLFDVTPARGSSFRKHGQSVLTKDKGGISMNEMTRTTSQNGTERLADEELKNVHDLSRLDQLFVQQIEDFLHFGYPPNMYQKPSYL